MGISHRALGQRARILKVIPHHWLSLSTGPEIIRNYQRSQNVDTMAGSKEPSGRPSLLLQRSDKGDAMDKARRFDVSR